MDHGSIEPVIKRYRTVQDCGIRYTDSTKRPAGGTATAVPPEGGRRITRAVGQKVLVAWKIPCGKHLGHEGPAKGREGCRAGRATLEAAPGPGAPRMMVVRDLGR